MIRAADHHFRDQQPRIVGSRLHRAIGAGGEDRQQVAGFGRRHRPVLRQIIAGFAHRADDVSDDLRRAGPARHGLDLVMRLVEGRAHEVVHRRVDDDEILRRAALRIR